MKGLRMDGTAIRVMAVDDSPITRKMIKKALEPEGFEIIGEAGNGKDAVELYHKIKPDIITMDVTMPIMDGLQAAQVIKEQNPAQKIVMLSAMSDQDIVAEARGWGIVHFCAKPFKPEEIVEKILRVISE
ncbi:MAG: response regulator [Syntrophomonadaceae bacterium]|nr:response regulator [Syntrophomonadaceae bacterium]MDD4563152.1 response regulator [Syntrophomonadaceae bacterium]